MMKSRMEPEYSPTAVEAEIAQRYKNAEVLEEGAQEERNKAKSLELILEDLLKKNGKD